MNLRVINCFLLGALGIFGQDFQTATHFVRMGNYFEAITEYRRILFYKKNLAHEERDKIYLELGDLYYLSGNYSKAESWYAEAKPSLGRALRQVDLLYRKGGSFYEALLEVVRTYPLAKEEVAYLKKEATRAFVSRGDYRRAKDMLSLSLGVDETEEKKMREFLKQGYEGFPYSMLFWGLIPGGAYFFLHEYQLALYSFVTVSVLAALGIYGYLQQAFLGSILAFSFALRYYLESISQAWRLIREENARREKKFREDFLQKTGGDVAFCSFSCSRLELSLSRTF
ncbi:MAG: tetratricopeptide repeat protein [Leptospiraceae bacterium]|nr:tetratricopeptide repeat protein [Leptospiraceae bacterium]MDW8306006.1 tetratricopeptide repeat protein [Leptospiraceae bacterium]